MGFDLLTNPKKMNLIKFASTIIKYEKSRISLNVAINHLKDNLIIILNKKNQLWLRKLYFYDKDKRRINP